MDPDTSFIQGVLGKYLPDYDEFKRRQRHHAMSQSIDAGALSRSLQLPPLMSPEAKPRETLRQQLPKFLSHVKEGNKPFAPSPKLSQSIDVGKYKSAAIGKFRLKKAFATLEHEAAEDDALFGEAMQRQNA